MHNYAFDNLKVLEIEPLYLTEVKTIYPWKLQAVHITSHAYICRAYICSEVFFKMYSPLDMLVLRNGTCHIYAFLFPSVPPKVAKG